MEKQADKSGPAILIADDNQMIVHLLGDVLINAGYRVTAVKSGEETLAVVPQIKPDLILLDVDMSGKSAFDVCRTLKQNPHTSDIPVMFVTSRRNQRDIITGFKAGGQDFINKPYTQAELLARIQTHLALRQALQKLKASEARYRELAIRDDLTDFTTPATCTRPCRDSWTCTAQDPCPSSSWILMILKSLWIPMVILTAVAPLPSWPM